MHEPAPDPDSAPDSHRLPRHTWPVRYDLELAPDLNAGTFAGSVSIEVEIREPTDTVVLHAVELDVATAWVRSDGGDLLDTTVEADPAHEWVRLQLPDVLGPGTAEVHLDFSGTLGDDLVGFYRAVHHDPDGTEATVAVTQFESTHARRAFPCFDEPEFKAVFGITLVVADGLLAVSNAAEVAATPEGDRTPEGNGRVRFTFADTLCMSSYLVAFVVGPLEVTEAPPVPGRDGPIPLRVVHLAGQGPLCGFALEVASAALVFFEDWYDLAYPGDKVDLVAVADFAFGAMENLGCIVFREVLLLVDPERATPQELQRVADVINHELAHMWFGDLVTMRWWDGIWLNEAFATFMEVSATDAFRPEWDAWSNFGLARASAFDTDALASTRPVEFEVVTAEDAEAMFDVLTYEKGCSVVRMIEQYLGAEVFRDGIRLYLRRHALANTDSADLWDALEEVSGEPVRRVMEAWIHTGGHPLVRVETTGDGLRLSRERARLTTPSGAASGDDSGDETSVAPWPVPVVLQAEALGGGARLERVLVEAPVEVHLGAPARVVQANVGGNGFYRTLLDEDLRDALARRGGTPLERFTLVDDTWFALLAGLLDVPGAWRTVEAVAAAEDDPSVWRRIAGAAAELLRLVGPDRAEEVRGWVRAVAAAAAGRIGDITDAATWSAVTGRRAEVVAVVAEMAGTTGADAAVRSAAIERFDAAPGAAEGGLDPALRAAVLAVVAASADPLRHAAIESAWRDADTPQDEQRHLGALVDTDDPELLDRSLALVLTDVRAQDGPYVVRRALANAALGDRSWHWVTERWAELVDRFPSSSVPRMLGGVRTFTDGALADSVTAFLEAHPLESGDQQVRQHVERMWAGVAAAERIRRV